MLQPDWATARVTPQETTRKNMTPAKDLTVIGRLAIGKSWATVMTSPQDNPKSQCNSAVILWPYDAEYNKKTQLTANIAEIDPAAEVEQPSLIYLPVA